MPDRFGNNERGRRLELGKKGEPLVHTATAPWAIGDPIPMRQGTDVAILSTGTLLRESLHAATELQAHGISATVLSFPTVKPLNHNFLQDVFSKHRLVVTVEEHSVLGGLGGSIAEWRCDQSRDLACLLRIGTPDEFLHSNGEQEHAREILGLTPAAMSQRITARLQTI